MQDMIRVIIMGCDTRHQLRDLTMVVRVMMGFIVMQHNIQMTILENNLHLMLTAERGQSGKCRRHRAGKPQTIHHQQKPRGKARTWGAGWPDHSLNYDGVVPLCKRRKSPMPLLSIGGISE